MGLPGKTALYPSPTSVDSRNLQGDQLLVFTCVLLQYRLDAREEVGQAFYPQAVVHHGPPLLVDHQSRVLQLAQVTRHGRHVRSHQLGKLANASLPPFAEFIDDHQPSGMRQRFEYLGPGFVFRELLAIHPRDLVNRATCDVSQVTSSRQGRSTFRRVNLAQAFSPS